MFRWAGIFLSAIEEIKGDYLERYEVVALGACPSLLIFCAEEF